MEIFIHLPVFFVHPDLDSVLFVGMQNRSIVLFSNHSNADKNELAINNWQFVSVHRTTISVYLATTRKVMNIAWRN